MRKRRKSAGKWGILIMLGVMIVLVVGCSAGVALGLTALGPADGKKAPSEEVLSGGGTLNEETPGKNEEAPGKNETEGETAEYVPGKDVAGIKPGAHTDGNSSGEKPASETGGGSSGEKPASGTGGGSSGEKPANGTGGNSSGEKPANGTGGGSSGEKPANGTGGNSSGEKPANGTGGGSSGEKPASGTGGGSSGEKPANGTGGNSSGEKPASETGGNSSGEKPASGTGGNSSGEKPASGTSGKPSGEGTAGKPGGQDGKSHQTGGKIALTFDDGPDTRYTTAILDILKEKDVKATFFVVGTQVKKYPDVLKRIVEEGHAIGNHTQSHKDLSKLTKSQIVKEIDEADAAIEDVLGYKPEMFRAPYGALSETLKKTLKEKDRKLVGWTVDTRDWAGTSINDMREVIRKGSKPNGIILMHSFGGKHIANTVEMLPQVIDDLRELGFTFVTADELVE
ncbi:polysaccharide deacetylase family protein [Paenibacillus sp. CAU 1782]